MTVQPFHITKKDSPKKIQLLSRNVKCNRMSLLHGTYKLRKTVIFISMQFMQGKHNTAHFGTVAQNLPK